MALMGTFFITAHFPVAGNPNSTRERFSAFRQALHNEFAPLKALNKRERRFSVVHLRYKKKRR